MSPPGMPFDLVLADQPVDAASGVFRTIVSLHGATRVTYDAMEVHLEEGEALVATPHEPALAIEPEGMAVVVTGMPKPA